MDLRQLNALVAIAEHGSFSAAADALATVQSNVSTHVKKLEIELGSELIDRGSGELTEAGVLAVDRARRILAELDALNSDVTALSSDISGTVRLGAIGTVARWLIPHLLQLVPDKHPLLSLVFCESTTIGIDRQLANGYVDLGVLVLPASGSEVRSVPLFEEDLGLALPSSHRLAARSSLTITEIAELPLLLPMPGSNYRDTLDVVAARARVTLQPRAETDSLRLLQALTFEGCGFAILPASSIPSGDRAEWRLVRVDGIAPRVVGVVQRRLGKPGAPVRAVLEILESIVAQPERLPEGVRPISADERAAHAAPLPLSRTRHRVIPV
ncbi:MAG: LysR family transcriptional regulator [Acidimicrobiales bacterium]